MWWHCSPDRSAEGFAYFGFKWACPKIQEEYDLGLMAKGLKVLRQLSDAAGVIDTDVFNSVAWKRFNCLIKNREGQVIFEQNGVEAPESWSQLAVDIAASKYFRRKLPRIEAESSIRQLINRVVKAIVLSAKKQGGYFQSEKDLENFSEELKYILVHQMAAFNSPVWFNAGVFEAYQLESLNQMWAWDFKKKNVVSLENAFERPQVSACFIQSVEDSLESIFDLAKNEAKLFKYGSGSGTNFSPLRSKYEELQTGGTSSGLIAFLEVLDRGAGAIKSGGTTRRAAKMVCVDIDHPEIIEFIEWKMNEEKKAKALIDAGYSSDFEGTAYRTISGQNANNSVRLTHQFMKAVEQDKDWSLRSRSEDPAERNEVRKIKARDLWQRLVFSTWSCADPGVQFHDTINEWHTCPESGEIRASNPCSEYMFLDDSACNLASVNLVKFLKSNGEFDLDSYQHVCRILLIAQDILVDYASYPTKKIAKNSHEYRPLGLGFANLGSLLMRQGLPYDSEQGRALAAALSAIMGGVAYRTSAELAVTKDVFVGFAKNKSAMSQVMVQHQQALKHVKWSWLASEFKSRAESLWQEVAESAADLGFRNSQVTVIAPTGTIGLFMDCDTTGIEPDFALVKLKKMVGGGEVEMINSAMPVALKKLGYSELEIQKIVTYVLKNNQITGAPGFQEKHQAVFSGATGVGALSAQSHILMMASVQPFISGAISKTVNLPETATEKDISEIFHQAWKLQLKAVAIYRDNSKFSQPLSQKVFVMKCPLCQSDTELQSGCYRCPNCGHTVGCA